MEIISPKLLKEQRKYSIPEPRIGRRHVTRAYLIGKDPAHNMRRMQRNATVDPPPLQRALETQQQSTSSRIL